MSLLLALRNRLFALLWSGQTVSRLGDSLYRIALAWWVLEKTGSAAAMGGVLVFSTVPMLVFMLFGGVMVDRLPRPLVMFLSDLLRGLLVTAIAVLAALGLLQVWQIFIASAVFGLVSAFFQPAYTAIVPEVVEPERLPSANSLTMLSGSVAGIGGPALGALIVSLSGIPLAFALDAASFFVAAVTLIPLLVKPLHVPLPTPAAAELPAKLAANLAAKLANKPTIWADLRDGLQAVLASPWLWITILVAALGNMTQASVISTSLPFLVKDAWHLDVNALGAIYSALSAGAVLAALVLGAWPVLRHRGLVAYLSWALCGLMVVSFGLQSSLLVALAAAGVIGATMTVFGLIWTHTLQELVPRELLGRVSSIDYLGSFALLPVGFALAGWATDQIGAPAVFVIGGALTTALALSALLHPAIRNMD
jgi:DHA3 family tetracycline resistance protein-like MFS transporter